MLSIRTTLPNKAVLPQGEVGVGKIEMKKQGRPIKFGPIPDEKNRDPNVIYIHSTPNTNPAEPGMTAAIDGKLYPIGKPYKSDTSAKVDAYLKDFYQRNIASSSPSEVPKWHNHFYTFGYKENLTYCSENSQNGGKVLV